MISGIVYTSNSGYTAQYARLLGAAEYARQKGMAR